MADPLVRIHARRARCNRCIVLLCVSRCFHSSVGSWFRPGARTIKGWPEEERGSAVGKNKQNKYKNKTNEPGTRTCFVCCTVTAPFAIGAAANQIQCRKKWLRAHQKVKTTGLCVGSGTPNDTRILYPQRGQIARACKQKKHALHLFVCLLCDGFGFDLKAS